jgi:hypothetical protein
MIETKKTMVEDYEKKKMHPFKIILKEKKLLGISKHIYTVETIILKFILEVQRILFNNLELVRV